MQQRNFLLTALIILTFGASKNIYAEEHQDRAKFFSKKAVHLRLDMRKLWEDHIVWTRNFIISAIAELGDENPVAERLLQNQDDIGDAFKPYFGRKMGNKLAELLREHILIAVDVVNDAIAGDTAKFDEDYAKWQKNARKIAKFLAKENSKYSKDKLKEMLYKHLELTTGEVSSRLNEDWAADIHFYDENHNHMLKFSDTLVRGIIKEFPDKFE
jgi:hypothetical protein